MILVTCPNCGQNERLVPYGQMQNHEVIWLFKYGGQLADVYVVKCYAGTSAGSPLPEVPDARATD